MNTAVPTSPLNKPTMGKYIALVNTSVGASPRNAIRANARLGSVGKVNELSQDDVSGAVLTSIVEPGLTMRDAILQLLAGGGGGGPSAIDVAAAVRTELAAELARIDAAVTTRQETGTPAAVRVELAPELSMAIDIWQRLGLDPENPQVTTATSIVAGGVDQSILESPGSVTVTRNP